MAIDTRSPYWSRPIVWDRTLQRFRRHFWNELTDEQKDAEIEHSIQENRRILADIQQTKRGKQHDHA